jgi:carbon monoxide dehydrogenase subunit G
VNASGEIHVTADPAAVFAFVRDPANLAPCIPGCSNVRDLGGGRYAATMSRKIGFIPVKIDVAIELTNVEPPSALDATVTGNAGPAGRVTASTRMRFEPDGGGTTIRYTVDVEMTGTIGSLGQAMVASKSDALADRLGVGASMLMPVAKASGFGHR